MNLLFVSYMQPKREKVSKRYEQGRQCSHNGTLRRVRATTDAVEKQ